MPGTMIMVKVNKVGHPLRHSNRLNRSFNAFRVSNGKLKVNVRVIVKVLKKRVKRVKQCKCHGIGKRNGIENISIMTCPVTHFIILH